MDGSAPTRPADLPPVWPNPASHNGLVAPSTVSITLTTVYVGFGLAAFHAYPQRFSPWANNWLSDLGNRDLNPHGWAYYAIGCALSGALLVVYFLGLGAWRRSGTPVRNQLLTAVQSLGTTSGVALIMTALFTEDHFEQHQFWSRILFGSFAMTLFVTPFALRRPGQQPRVLLNTVCFLGYLAVFASAVAATAHWLEWVCVASFLLYALLLGIMTQHSVYAGHKK